jgi:formylglycine-generating enzyme required for sulfatase activity
MRRLSTFWAVPAVVLLAASASLGVDIETVPIGDAGNADDDTGYGAVDYSYNIGKFEVTAGQYCEFLNAVADDDTYGLYDEDMWDDAYDSSCKIERSGSAGSYTYSVAADWADRPVNYVGWGEAARFANWLHNGQPSGAQDNTTTEDGSYFLNGATSDEDLGVVTREPDAPWVIPAEDEWYKAAYYDPALNAGAGGYYDYATGTDTTPSNDLIDPDPGNNANYRILLLVLPPDYDYTIGSPYWRTPVGEFENSESPYGTFDQSGNVFEWNEEFLIRGGSFDADDTNLDSSCRLVIPPNSPFCSWGFRVAEVPEPASAIILLLSLPLMLRGRAQRR